MIDDLYSKRIHTTLRNIPSPRQDLTFAQLKIYYQERGYRFANSLELLTPDGKYNYVAYLLADENGVSVKVAKYAGNKDKSLNYESKDDEMLITVHRWFANKSCPGNWLYVRLGDLAAKVTAQLGAYTVLDNAKAMADKHSGFTAYDWNGKTVYGAEVDGKSDSAAEFSNMNCPFMVKVGIDDLNIRKGSGTNTAKTGRYTGKGVFTIVEVREGKGSDKGWGRLKSGAGWISLDYCQRV